MTYRCFLQQFFEKSVLCDEAKETLMQALSALPCTDTGDPIPFLPWRKQAFYSKGGTWEGYEEAYEEILRQIQTLAQKEALHPFSLNALFCLFCAQHLQVRYQERGIAEEIFWDTVLDIAWKMELCHRMHGVFGIHLPRWYRGFWQENLIKLGRLQYEKIAFPFPYYEKDGIQLKKGDPIFSVHIPEDGPLLLSCVLESFSLAQSFFGLPSPTPFYCHTWILNEHCEELFPKESNLRAFSDLFSVLQYDLTEHPFWDAFRIFGTDYHGDPNALPVNTGLQRRIVALLKQGKQIRCGMGIYLHYEKKAH